MSFGLRFAPRCQKDGKVQKRLSSTARAQRCSHVSRNSPVDLCIVAGRRPELLATTVKNLNFRLLRNFNLSRVIVNLDPIFGSEADARACRTLLESTFPNVEITEPEHPGFAAAVRRNWLRTSADLILHFEDDWMVEREVSPTVLGPFQDARVTQVAFNTLQKNWDIDERGAWQFGRAGVSVLGRRVPLPWRRPIFTTSPSFLRGSFARQAAELMDVTLDPEKQFYTTTNPVLERFVRPFRCVLVGNKPDFMMRDIGRQWRDDRSIEKRIVNGESIWIELGTGHKVSDA